MNIKELTLSFKNVRALVIRRSDDGLLLPGTHFKDVSGSPYSGVGAR
jgi:hypothetical protein